MEKNSVVLALVHQRGWELGEDLGGVGDGECLLELGTYEPATPGFGDEMGSICSSGQAKLSDLI